MFCLGVFVWGVFVWGVFGKGGFCPGGFCLGVYVWGVFVWGVFVLEPPFSNIMAPLTLFNEGVRDHFPICGIFVLLYFGIFVRYFLWWGVLYCFPLHMTMVWDLARGAGIPAPSDAIDVWVSKHQSALIGGDGDSQLHCRAAGLRT